ncbi:hypothetical protein EIP86_010030 [Pleurotus ostreatoroseus]|nr:hypothetical protein EIP86_010030 [Pleurotus ostreatoroseus]
MLHLLPFEGERSWAHDDQCDDVLCMKRYITGRRALCSKNSERASGLGMPSSSPHRKSAPVNLPKPPAALPLPDEQWTSSTTIVTFTTTNERPIRTATRPPWDKVGRSHKTNIRKSTSVYGPSDKDVDRAGSAQSLESALTLAGFDERWTALFIQWFGAPHAYHKKPRGGVTDALAIATSPRDRSPKRSQTRARTF